LISQVWYDFNGGKARNQRARTGKIFVGMSWEREQQLREEGGDGNDMVSPSKTLM